MSIFSIFGKRNTEPRLPFVTDIHCHVVPGVDDGSPDAATSVELVKRMQQWGIKRIIATPHVTESTFENTPDILDPALEELRRRRIQISAPPTRAGRGGEGVVGC
ncbi:MAG: hypothetical protein K2K92_10315, partial [Duncaniella sp.]|nr:hypothetical protein [Duncaniella sp.]